MLKNVGRGLIEWLFDILYFIEEYYMLLDCELVLKKVGERGGKRDMFWVIQLVYM